MPKLASEGTKQVNGNMISVDDFNSMRDLTLSDRHTLVRHAVYSLGPAPACHRLRSGSGLKKTGTEYFRSINK